MSDDSQGDDDEGGRLNNGEPTPSASAPLPSPTTAAQAHEDLIGHARKYYTTLGYRVHSGLQFGCELVLYADDPNLVHSDFCVLVLPHGGRIDWRRMQSLTRSMGDWKKTLILAQVKVTAGGTSASEGAPVVEVKELAVSTEHAPFRHRRQAISITGTVEVGSQRKKRKISKERGGEKTAGGDAEGQTIDAKRDTHNVANTL